MGDQPSTAQEEVIAVDPDYMSHASKDDGEKSVGSSVRQEGKADTNAANTGKAHTDATDTNKTDTDATDAEKTAKDATAEKEKEKEGAGMGNYNVSIPSSNDDLAAAKPLLHSASWGTEPRWTGRCSFSALFLRPQLA